MKRDRRYMKQILKELLEIWEENPDMRLSQLIENLDDYYGAVYYAEDEDLIKKLKHYYGEDEEIK